LRPVTNQRRVCESLLRFSFCAKQHNKDVLAATKNLYEVVAVSKESERLVLPPYTRAERACYTHRPHSAYRVREWSKEPRVAPACVPRYCGDCKDEQNAQPKGPLSPSLSVCCPVTDKLNCLNGHWPGTHPLSTPRCERGPSK
jgi:hypothetical protein